MKIQIQSNVLTNADSKLSLSLSVHLCSFSCAHCSLASEFVFGYMLSANMAKCSGYGVRFEAFRTPEIEQKITQLFTQLDHA